MANLRTTGQTEEHFRKVFNREMTPDERRIVSILLDDEPYPSSCWRQHSSQRPEGSLGFRCVNGPDTLVTARMAIVSFIAQTLNRQRIHNQS
jgi:hypothetical protein